MWKDSLNRLKSPGLKTDSLSDLYDEGYFHGRNSGYPTEGYRTEHPDWAAWLEFISLIKPAGFLIDVGCAYGYLVGEARRRGYQACGLDISRFALRQEAEIRPWLLESSASSLPFKNGSADIMTAFDVLEHLEHPYDCLAELRRVLKKDGLIVGATPDPVFFNRFEETHISERPPSFWLAAFRSLGFEVQFRFSGEPYNFQFAAAPAGSATASRLHIFQHDYFDQRAELVQVEERASSLLDSAPRFGWGPREQAGRRLTASPAAVYLLNRSDGPLALRFKIHIRHSPAFSTLRVRLNSYVINETTLDSEQAERTIQVEDILLPAGGHHLFFDLFPGGPEVIVQAIAIDAKPASRARLVSGLPFDLFQRYRLSSEIARVLKPETVLDIGGYIGDQNGHLAVAHDFLQPEGSSSPEITVTDLRQCDHADYFRAPAGRQPFADANFDLVMSLDVLEHLPVADRESFLQELDRLSRRWILLGAPFASSEVDKAETQLAASIMQTRHFLQEHRELGLPTEAFVRDFFRSRGYEVRSFPNGYLPSWVYWQVTTQSYFALNDYDLTRRYNSLYAAVIFPEDNREPAYRHILLVSKSALDAAAREELTRIFEGAPGRHPMDELGFQPAFFETHQRIAELAEKRQKALTDVQFLINERQKYIAFLEQKLEHPPPLWRLALSRLRRRLGLKR